MGRLYAQAQRFYGREGGWTKDMLRNIVAKDEENLSAEEFAKITGEKYTAPAREPSEVEKTQLIMMEAMADQYEERMEQELNNMEVMATIYEAVLELGGGI